MTTPVESFAQRFASAHLSFLADCEEMTIDQCVESAMQDIDATNGTFGWDEPSSLDNWRRYSDVTLPQNEIEQIKSRTRDIILA